MPPEPTVLDNEELQMSVTALGYYLYKQAGCPNGNNIDGFGKWMEQRYREFEALCESDPAVAAFLENTQKG